jgi:TrmH family RNA methyltransferase
MLSRSNERLLHALQRRKSREAEGLFVAEGVRVVEELVRSPIDLRFALVSPSLEDNPRGRQLLAELEARTTVSRVSDAELKRHAGTDAPQGVLAVAVQPIENAGGIKPGDHTLLLVADGVQDPGNLGTLIRIADAFAASAVIALSGTVDPWNPKVVRSSAGSSFHLPIVNATVEELSDWMERYHVTGFAAEAGGESPGSARGITRVALFVGNEGAGLREQTRTLATRTIGIPMPGRAESLNVAVAAGILLYELSRRMG